MVSWLAAAGTGVVAALAERIRGDARAAVLLMVEADLALLAAAAFLFPLIASLRAGLAPPLGGLAPSATALALLLCSSARRRRAERGEKATR